jgi:hypothetical protein
MSNFEDGLIENIGYMSNFEDLNPLLSVRT